MKNITFLLLFMFAGLAYGQSTANDSTQKDNVQKEEFKEHIVSIDIPVGSLEGVLLSPETQITDTVVLIIAGSGPTDRDGNSAFITSNALKLLAEGLAESGISSLRYDKRGVGGSRTAKVEESELRFEHFIDDAKSWIDYLQQKKTFSNIVVAGHSEGALIGTVVSRHNAVKKFVSLAGPGQSVDKTLRAQLSDQPAQVLEMATPILDDLVNGKTVDEVPNLLTALFRPSVQPFLISLFQFDPAAEIAKLNKPVLIVQGTTDIQVSVDDANLLAAGNSNAQLEIIDGMNHIFKTVALDRQANIATYNQPELPINEELVQALTQFIKSTGD